MRDRYRHDERSGMLTGGLIVLGVGVLFLLINFDLIPNLRRMWPLFPIIVGLALIISALLKGRGGSGESA